MTAIAYAAILAIDVVGTILAWKWLRKQHDQAALLKKFRKMKEAK